MSEGKVEQWERAAIAITEAFYKKDLDRGYGHFAPRMLLTNQEIAKIIAAHAPSLAAAPAENMQLYTMPSGVIVATDDPKLLAEAYARGVTDTAKAGRVPKWKIDNLLQANPYVETEVKK